MDTNNSPYQQPEWFRNEASARIRMEIRPCSVKDLCKLYGLGYKSMATMLKPLLHKIGQRNGRYYTVRQVETILDTLGPPYYIADEPEEETTKK